MTLGYLSSGSLYHGFGIQNAVEKRQTESHYANRVIFILIEHYLLIMKVSRHNKSIRILICYKVDKINSYFLTNFKAVVSKVFMRHHTSTKAKINVRKGLYALKRI